MIHSYNGFEGQVELSGSRAVAALFLRWELRRRREEASSGKPSWTLHAVLSYQKDVLLKHPKFQRRVFIKVMPDAKWFELVPLEGVEPVIREGQLTIEGVELVQTDQRGRP